jgi:hypothetical protein
MYIWFWTAHITIVGGRDNILELLASKDVNGHEMTLGMTMLSSLWGRHLNNLPPPKVNNMSDCLCIGVQLDQ